MFYNGKNLEEVLEEHKKYISILKKYVSELEMCVPSDCGSFAIFSDYVLENIDFSSIDLTGAYFSNCIIRNCKFNESCLCGTNFFHSVIVECWFLNANMRDANLVRAIVKSCDFRNADLFGTDLEDSNFILCCFDKASMKYARVCGAHISFTATENIEDAPVLPIACPDTGSFIGWKKCYSFTAGKPVIVKLRIPENAKRLSAGGTKCRCSEAIVEDIQYIDGSHCDYQAVSYYRRLFIYKIGETVRPEEAFDDNPFKECASGIHFFVDRTEAVNYVF